MEFIRTRNPHKTIPDVCEIYKHNCRPDTPTTAMFQADYCIYQQDNAACHKSRILREQFKKRFSEFQVVS